MVDPAKASPPAAESKDAVGAPKKTKSGVLDAPKAKDGAKSVAPAAAAARMSKKWTAQTPHIEGGGSNVEWSIDATDASHKLGGSWKVDVRLEDLGLSSLKVTVKDKNNFRSDAVIGEGQVSLSSVAAAGVGGEEVVLKVALVDDKRKAAGEVIIMLQMTSVQAPTEPLPSTPFQTATMIVKKVAAKDLRNVEVMGGQNDPYVVCELVV